MGNEDKRILDLRKTILEDNDADADLLRKELKRDHTFYLNLMSSPGAGKTTVIRGTVQRLKDRLKIGVIEADIDSDVDAVRLRREGIHAVQVHTGGMCHLDAAMSRQALEAVGASGLDLVILENVGNLVCPAEFDTGACLDVVILSVPEGDDKPLKYPLVFRKSGAALINKTDALPVFDFDPEKAAAGIRDRNPSCAVFPVSAETGEGMDAWCTWLFERIRKWRSERP